MAARWSLLQAAVDDEDGTVALVQDTAEAQRACINGDTEPGGVERDSVRPTTEAGAIALGMTRESPLRPGTPPQHTPRVLHTDKWMDDVVVGTAARVYKLHRVAAKETGDGPPPGLIVDTFAACTILRRYLKCLHLAVKRPGAPAVDSALAALRRVVENVCQTGDGSTPPPAASVSCAMACEPGWAGRAHPTGWDLTRTERGKAGVVLDAETGAASPRSASGLFAPQPGFEDGDRTVHTLNPLEWWKYLASPADRRKWMRTATSQSRNTHWACVTVYTQCVVDSWGRASNGRPKVCPGKPTALSWNVLVEVRDTLLGKQADVSLAATYPPVCLLARALALVGAYVNGMPLTTDSLLAFHATSTDAAGTISYQLHPDQLWLAHVPQQGSNADICGVVAAAALLDIMVTGGRASRHPASGLSFGDVAIVATGGAETFAVSLMRVLLLVGQTLGTVPGYPLLASTSQKRMLEEYRKAWARHLPAPKAETPTAGKGAGGGLSTSKARRVVRGLGKRKAES